LKKAAMGDDGHGCGAAAAAAVSAYKPKEPLMRPVRSSAAAVAAEDSAAVVGAAVGRPLVFFRWIQSWAEAVGLFALDDWRAWQERNLKRLGKLSISISSLSTPTNLINLVFSLHSTGHLKLPFRRIPHDVHLFEVG
jgi:hypothetical protein